MQEKARLWDEHIAAQEAERRAIAEREERREKLRQNVEKYTENIAKLEAKLAEAIRNQDAARTELSELEEDVA